MHPVLHNEVSVWVAHCKGKFANSLKAIGKIKHSTAYSHVEGVVTNALKRITKVNARNISTLRKGIFSYTLDGRWDLHRSELFTVEGVAANRGDGVLRAVILN